MTKPANMNPRAPHFRKPTSSTTNSDDLASVFSSLRNMGSTPSAPASSVSNGDASQSQNHSLVKFDPNSSVHEYQERARAELSDNDKTLMLSKILQLSDQVGQLLDQRSDFENKQAENDRVTQELRAQVVSLKGQVNTHHKQLESAKQLLSERSCVVHAVDARIGDVEKTFEQQIKQQETRTNNVGSFAKGLEAKLNLHSRLLRDHEDYIDELKKTVDDNKKVVDDNKLSATNAMTQFVPAQNRTESSEMQELRQYIKQIGEKLLEHQNSIDTTGVAMNGMRTRYETLNALVAKLSGQKEYTNEGGTFKIEPGTAAIFQIQTQVNRIEKEIERKASNDVDSVNSDSSSLNATEELQIKVDNIRTEMREMEAMLASQTNKQKIMDDVALSARFRLEDIFFDLSKVINNKCLAHETEFGVDGDEAFIIRQRVLERLSVDDKVQVEYEKLTERREWKDM